MSKVFWSEKHLIDDMNRHLMSSLIRELENKKSWIIFTQYFYKIKTRQQNNAHAFTQDSDISINSVNYEGMISVMDTMTGNSFQKDTGDLELIFGY